MRLSLTKQYNNTDATPYPNDNGLMDDDTFTLSELIEELHTDINLEFWRGAFNASTKNNAHDAIRSIRVEARRANEGEICVYRSGENGRTEEYITYHWTITKTEDRDQVIDINNTRYTVFPCITIGEFDVRCDYCENTYSATNPCGWIGHCENSNEADTLIMNHMAGWHTIPKK